MRQLCRHSDVVYPNEITRTHLLNWRNTVVGEGIKPITWNSYLRHLKCIYKFGIEQSLLDYKENPCNKLFLRVGKAKRKTLTDNQLKKLDFFLSSEGNLPEVLHPQWFVQALVNTFRFTGIRRAQLLRLKIGDIDLYQKVIHISPEINK
ncbi:tyrosine-type recombinase/integrase, partial [Avibacterium paragallinarum]